MGEKTTISWANSTVNPLLARLKEPLSQPNREKPLPVGKLGFHCVKVSAECALCYAERFNKRGLPERGTGLPYTKAAGEKVEIVLHRPALDQVLRWSRPRMIFWCSMTDLFGEFVPSEMIQEVLDVAVRAGEERGHISQLLTKRADRMLIEVEIWAIRHGRPLPACIWPGFSAGNRKLFGERWPTVRKLGDFADGPLWCSYEPAIGPLVDPADPEAEAGFWKVIAAEGLAWCVWGGESGPGARPFRVQWGRDVNCFFSGAGIKIWAKQLGAVPTAESFLLNEGWPDHVIYRKDRTATNILKLRDRKGADSAEWPADLCVREFPVELGAA